MRRLRIALLATAGLAALGTAASAADLAPRYKAPVPVATPACAQFGGFYVGANVGAGYYDHKFNDRDSLAAGIDPGLPSSLTTTDTKVVGGVQGGYNWQTGCTVFGIETDWNWTGLRGFEWQGDGNTVDSLTVESRLRWFGSTRLRTGVVVNNLLLYVTGGVAYGRFNRNWTFFEDAPATLLTVSSDRSKLGWTAGFGTEWAFLGNWSLKSEVLYTRFVDDQQTFTGAFGAIGIAGRQYRLESQDSMWVSRIGLNYRFGGGPVYAAY